MTTKSRPRWKEHPRCIHAASATQTFYTRHPNHEVIETLFAVIKNPMPNRTIFAPSANVMQIANGWPRQNFPEPYEEKSLSDNIHREY
jgi:hypothetical protein